MTLLVYFPINTTTLRLFVRLYCLITVLSTNRHSFATKISSDNSHAIALCNSVESNLTTNMYMAPFQVYHHSYLRSSITAQPFVGCRAVHAFKEVSPYRLEINRRKRIVTTMTAKKLTSLSKESLDNLLGSIDVVLSDCDGVLWTETKVIAGSPDTVAAIKKLGKKFFYITNNGTKTRSEVLAKCKSFNYDPQIEEVVCTSFLTAVFLKEKKFDKKVYIVGSAAIAKELEQENIKHCGVGPDIIDKDELRLIQDFKPDPEIAAVVVGFDKDFSYPKLMKAATYLANPAVQFIGTNYDLIRPSLNSNKFPGAGCLIKAVEAASGRTATVVGKPETYLCSYLMKTYGLNPARTLMIGDNCSTDILLGKRCGFKTLLVLSGVTSESDVIAMGNSAKTDPNVPVPDYYTNQLSDLLPVLST